MKLKQRVYALFQFLTFIALILFFSVGMIIYSNSHISIDPALKWKPIDPADYFNSDIQDVLSFRNHSSKMLFAGFMSYAGIAIIITTWVLGFLVFKVKDRNLFDSMFLMFVIIPGVANIFCLIAQLSLHTQTYTSSKLDKEEIEMEKTKIINIFEERAKNIQKENKLHYNNMETIGEIQESLSVENDPVVMQIIGEVNTDMPTTKKVAAKPAAKKVAAKPAAKKATVKKATVAKPAAAKKVAAKKPAAKKPAAKKAAK